MHQRCDGHGCHVRGETKHEEADGELQAAALGVPAKDDPFLLKATASSSRSCVTQRMQPSVCMNNDDCR